MNVELLITIGVLLIEIAVFVLCTVLSGRPPDPNRPRLFPYALTMIMLALAIFVTVAHTMSVVTGHRIEGRTKMKGQ